MVTVGVDIVLISGVVVLMMVVAMDTAGGTLAVGDLLMAPSLTPFPLCLLPLTISASLGLPSSATGGGGGAGGGIIRSCEVGSGGKLTGAKSSLGGGRLENL